MSIEPSVIPWKRDIVIDGRTFERWECGHWHPIDVGKYAHCRFCYPNGLPPVWSKP